MSYLKRRLQVSVKSFGAQLREPAGEEGVCAWLTISRSSEQP